MTKKILLVAVAFLACEKLPEDCGNQFINSDTQFCVNSQTFERCWGKEFDPLTEFCHENVVYSKCNGQVYTPPNNPCGERSSPSILSSSSLNVIGYSSSSEAGSSSSLNTIVSSSSLNIDSSSSSSIGGSSSSEAGNSSSSNIGNSSSSATSSSSSVVLSSSSSNVPGYTVTFDGNGATSGAPPAAVKVDLGSAAIYLPGRGTLERTGYTFGGWDAVSPYTVTGDVTIYAKWIPIFTVSFDGNEATGGVRPAAMQADSGSAIQLPGKGNLQRTGHAFAGWTANLYGTGDSYAAGSSYTVTSNITLYAVWAVACTGSDNTSTHYCSEGGLPLKAYGFITDDRSYPHQTYKTVVIGTQTWMAENLNYPAEGSKCYSNSESNCVTYGRLYDWATAMNLPNCGSSTCASQIQPKHRGICPEGWHIPSQADWNVMTAYIGGASTEGKMLKATSGWNSNGNGTDEFGFSALPGGYGGSDGGFSNVGYQGDWWSASENSAANAYRRLMYYNVENASWINNDKSSLYSIRCVKD